MTTVTLTSTETRHSKALALLADSGQWLRDRQLSNGRQATGIPSQRVRGLYHWTDGQTCSCYDFRRRQLACKHVLACRLDAIARPVQPASDVVDGLSQMVADRTPVLDMVRHEDGEISWTRHEHADGSVTRLPDHVTLAAKYDSIWARFSGD